jgi:hypothetical protein
MAQWQTYRKAGKYFCNGGMTTGDQFSSALYASDSNANDITLRFRSEINGPPISGTEQVLQGVQWSEVGPGVKRLTASPVIWAGSLVGISGCVVHHQLTTRLVAYCLLNSVPFSVPLGQSLSVGCTLFELS